MNILYAKMMHGFFGGEKQTEELIRGLKKRGHNLFLLTLPKSEIAEKLKDVPQQAFYLYPYPNKRIKSLFFLILSPYYIVSFFFVARKIVKKHNIDVACFQEPYEKFIFSPAFRVLGVKIVWLEILYWEPYLSANKFIFYPMLWSSRFCDAVIFSSAFLKKQIFPYLKSQRTVLIRHALREEDQKKFISPNSIKKYPIKKIGFIGSITCVKGVFTLLEAFERLIAEGESIKLFYAGAGEVSDELKKAIRSKRLSNYAKILGKQKADKFFKEVDLLVVPSHLDNLPYVIQEAMCAKVPIIASNTGGIPEYFTDKTKEWLAQPGDTEGLAKKISDFLRLSAKSVSIIAEENFNFYQENYNFEKMLDQTERLFKTL